MSSKTSPVMVLSLLRGINVGGRNVRMSDLKKLYEDLLLTHIQTYIQSGNVLCSCDIAALPELARQLEEEIAVRYGFHSPVLLRTRDEMEAVLAHNPFLQAGADLRSLHVTFLAQTPIPEKVQALHEWNTGTDRFHLKGREVYLCCPDGYGHTKLSNTFFEKKLQVSATTRNWKTVTELYQQMS